MRTEPLRHSTIDGGSGRTGELSCRGKPGRIMPAEMSVVEAEGHVPLIQLTGMAWLPCRTTRPEPGR
jgi:hypothetical protein